MKQKKYYVMRHRLCGAIAIWIGLTTIVGPLIAQPLAIAQVTPDSTLSTTITSSDNLNFVIDGGDACCTQADQRGSNNLFHSFDEFSVPTRGSAHFNNATDIDIIFSRVTGDTISDINGRISANGAADLFLINPNGIIFGQHASLDIGGSFISSTAESLLFADGTKFSTIPSTNSPLLTMSVPAGLQMGQSPGRINQTGATLQTAAGQTLALVGSEITLTNGTIEVPGDRGRIELMSLGPENTARLSSMGKRWRIDSRNAVQFSNLTLRNALLRGSGNGNSSIHLSGANIRATNSQVQSFNQGDQHGGGIVITSTHLFTANNSDFTLGVQAAGDTGTLRITAPITRFINNGGVGSIVTQEGIGHGGNLRIRGDRLTMVDHSGFGVFTDGKGDSGDVFININEVMIRGESGFGVFTNGSGNSGKVTIRGHRMVTTNEAGGGMSTSSTGNAGDLNIFVNEFLLTRSSGYGLRTSGEGNAGNVHIEADTIVIRDESGFSTTTTGNGLGGNILLKAQDITLDASQINARTEGTANAGALTIEADTVSLLNGGQLNTFTRSEADAGDIEVIARDRMVLSGQDRLFERRTNEPGQDDQVSPFSGIFGNTLDRASGKGGNVTITTPYLRIDDQARISVSAEGQGNAGNLRLNANTVFLRQQASIQSEATAGSGGNLFLNVDQALFLTDASRITTMASANGGDITIQDPVSIVGLQNSDIIANAIEGDGGTIRLNAQGLFGFKLRKDFTVGNDGTSDISASSQRGINGTIDINAFTWEPDSGLIELPSNLVDASDRIVHGCAFAGKNRFIVTGRRGLPTSPLGESRRDRPWFQILPDFGPIPDRNLRPPIIPHGPPSSSPNGSSTDPEHPSTISREATEIAIASNGTLQLVASHAQIPRLSHPTCTAAPNSSQAAQSHP